jgi:hypothetical protein
MTTLTTYSAEDYPQRSPQWLELRRGMVTASTVGQLVTTKQLTAIDFACPACETTARESCRSKRTGTPIATLHPERAEVARADDSPPVLVLADNETTRSLAAVLAAERIAGVDPDNQLGGRDIWRGMDSEPYARDAYAQHYGVEVTEVGFMTLACDGYTIGLSPDGLVGADGGLEVKAPRQKGHLLNAVNGVVPAEHVAQIQTALLVTGRDWWDLVSFHGGMRLWVKRVYPDPDWFAAIHYAVSEFQKTVARMVTDYYAATAGFPLTEPLPDPFEVELKL